MSAQMFALSRELLQLVSEQKEKQLHDTKREPRMISVKTGRA